MMNQQTDGVGHDAREESGILTVGWLADRFAGRRPGQRVNPELFNDSNKN